ncbi:MAG TPA: alpha/beta fold hydrolase [Blastocatellia bacterium]|nr:alpha/beta fold hydrolase [Blastocatellia bacterium]
MAIKQRNVIIRLAGALLPAVAGILVVIGLFAGYLVYLVTHPKRAREDVTPQQFSMLTGTSLAWSEENWLNQDGTKAVGWFLRGTVGAPAIILNHSYGRNRSELLDLGIKLRETGYHVLLPDLRGHGTSPVAWTSLGEYEGEDVLSAISFLKQMKTSTGQPLVDSSRIGLYGVSLGGYAALVAAHRDPAIRTVIADGAYRDPRILTRSLMGEMFSNAGTELDGFLNLGLKCYFLGRYHETSVETAVSKLSAQKVWFITSNSAGVFDHSMRELFAVASGQKEMVTFDHSRASRLEGSEQAAYDDRIVSYFRRAMPREAGPSGAEARATLSNSSVASSQPNAH